MPFVKRPLSEFQHCDTKMGLYHALSKLESACIAGRDIITIDIKNAFNCLPFQIISQRLHETEVPANI